MTGSPVAGAQVDAQLRAAASWHPVTGSPRSSVVVLVPAFACALAGCLEPNPYLELADTSSTGDPSTTGDPTGDPGTSDTTGDPVGPCPDPDLCLGVEQLEFSLQGNDSFTAELPKPAGAASTAPIASVRRYQPGQSETVGWAVSWTESATSWTVEITVSGAAPNSRVAGVAAVLGFGAGLSAPTVERRTVTTADGCVQLPVTGDDASVVVDAVERYAPGDAAVFEFSRAELVEAGAVTAIEYCVTQPEQLDAELGVTLLRFELGDNGSLAPIATTLADGQAGSDSFTELGQASEVVHLVGARALGEAAAPDLGWSFDCASSAPFACDYALVNASPGVTVEAGGAALAIQ